MGAECWRDYARKLTRWAGAGERVAAAARDWATHDRILRDLLAGPEALVAALRSAGAPVLFSEVAPPADEATARWAVSSCHLMRDRFSVADMACFLGIWDAACVDELLSAAASLAGAA